MQDQTNSLSVLFCCMGNICRSPTVEGVFRRQVIAAGLENHIHIDSAGTHSYHVGHAPDQRSQTAAAARGYKLGELCARQVRQQDFAEFDFILAMDNSNLAELRRMARPEDRSKPRLFMEYATRHAEREVPDPYYGGLDGFEQVLDMAEDGCAGLLTAIKKKLGG
ncbi:MAG: low molecular weight phosphotyrosine protein phosphatase [Prolixibacteraceae bacterium]|nr:low molecular weight phosphotyrosine protein phosphatase [Burkholderiales bacterium]